MKKWNIGIVIAAGALALAGGIGIAAARANSGQNAAAGFYAASDNGSFARQNVEQWYCGGRGLAGYITPQVAALLGTTQDDLRAQFASGKTLADLAGAKGVSQDTLIQTLAAPYMDHLALMVKYGYLSQAQADAYAEQAKARLQSAITSQNASGAVRGGGMMGGWSGNGAGGMMGGWSGNGGSVRGGGMMGGGWMMGGRW